MGTGAIIFLIQPEPSVGYVEELTRHTSYTVNTVSGRQVLDPFGHISPRQFSIHPDDFRNPVLRIALIVGVNGYPFVKNQVTGTVIVFQVLEADLGIDGRARFRGNEAHYTATTDRRTLLLDIAEFGPEINQGAIRYRVAGIVRQVNPDLDLLAVELIAFRRNGVREREVFAVISASDTKTVLVRGTRIDTGIGDDDTVFDRNAIDGGSSHYFRYCGGGIGSHHDPGTIIVNLDQIDRTNISFSDVSRIGHRTEVGHIEGDYNTRIFAVQR